MKLKAVIAIALLLALSCGHTRIARARDHKTTAVQLGKALSSPGRFALGSCLAELSVSPKGGFRVLKVGAAKQQPAFVADDVTAFSWATPELLVYSVSPVYGRPGIYGVICSSLQVHQLVRPTKVSKAYPDGSDFFELMAVTNTGPVPVVCFYHVADVDSAELERLKTDSHLFRISLHGGKIETTSEAECHAQ